jgi:hypothetical protein
MPKRPIVDAYNLSGGDLTSPWYKLQDEFKQTGLSTVTIAYADATGTLDGTVAIEVSNDARLFDDIDTVSPRIVKVPLNSTTPAVVINSPTNYTDITAINISGVWNFIRAVMVQNTLTTAVVDVELEVKDPGRR